MKVKELVGKDLMMAYDGKYLSDDFGYSCANFNLSDGSGGENTPDTFDFYTKNPKNISCIVAYNNKNKICGRRMFFKGKSLINDEIFDAPVKMGAEIKYLYGYYGCRDRSVYYEINKYVLKNYTGVIHMDNAVLNNGVVDDNILNYFIMEVESSDYRKFPPIDCLYICQDLNALSNFKPRRYILEELEKEFDKENLNFYQAYRFDPSKTAGDYSTIDYKTWLDNYSLKNEEEEEDES